MCTLYFAFTEDGHGGGFDPIDDEELRNMFSDELVAPPGDPKRIKRIMANRQSAQRSRVRKLQYISELERSVTTLQTEVSALSPTVAFLDHQRLLLNVDNSAIKQRLATLAQDKIFKDGNHILFFNYKKMFYNISARLGYDVNI
ncbi:basic leucine zipper 61-like [Salvia splendens]|uniref:basic leucine zipper 61-like n=1 Tax=Salvia splendens TaxID=180675 RepID=UPI001C25E242|nr:basic leucine zipper 61-like [Salvia splendens]